MEIDKEGYTGEFMGGDNLKKNANWFKDTHFVFEDDKTRIMK